MVESEADHQSSEPSLAPGQTLGGCQIIKQLEEGAYARVYLAREMFSDSVVALKVLKGTPDTKAAKRFQREARICGRLVHPGIALVKSYGTDGDLRFLVMEYVDGQPLDQLIKTCGAVTPGEFVSIFTDVLLALSFAHSKQVIHRDIKPSNIIVTTKGNDIGAKLLDFGLATMVESDESVHQGLTTKSTIAGSPPYMSPEQCEARPLSNRTDIYSIGCTMYESLVGVPPFDGESAYIVLTKHLSAPAAFPEQPAVAVPLKNIILRCLEKDPAMRYSSADDILSELRALDPTAIESETTDKHQAKHKDTSLLRAVVVALMVVLGLFATANLRPRNCGTAVPLTPNKQDRPKKKSIGLNSLTALQKIDVASSRHQFWDPEYLMLIQAACKDAAKESFEVELTCHRKLLDVYYSQRDCPKCIEEAKFLERLADKAAEAPLGLKYQCMKRAAVVLSRMDPLEAKSACDRAFTYASKMEDTDAIFAKSEMHEVYADVCANLSDAPQALSLTRKALEELMMSRPDLESEVVRLQARIAMLAVRTRNWKIYHETFKELDVEFTTAATAAAMSLLGEVLLDEGRLDEAARILVRAQQVLSKSMEKSQRDSYIGCLVTLGHIRHRQANSAEARRLLEQARALLKDKEQELAAMDVHEAMQLRDEHLEQRVAKLKKALEADPPPLVRRQGD